MQGQTVLVLGLGDSGLAMARWAAAHGAQVRVWDTREQAPQDAALQAAVPGTLRLSGELQQDAWAGVTRVLKSPGLSPLDPRLAGLYAWAQQQGVPVDGELTLFAQALQQLRMSMSYCPKVIAITGTNGKTTTTSLTGLLVARCGQQVAVAGNIGPTMLDTLRLALDAQAPELPQVWVLELSSFQLDGVRDFEPDAATVLNVSEDHLDWHGDMAAYVQAKARVFGQNGCMVLNRDDAQVLAMLPVPTPQKGRLVKPQVRAHQRFGLGAPTQPGDWGIVSENGMAWLVRALPADETIKPKRGEVLAEELHLQRLMPADALRIRGRHNAANALAALALVDAIGLPLAPALHGLRTYEGEPHRVSYVATVREIDAFDDSKGTNVGATVAAIMGLGQDRSPARLVVILGGDGKGQSFEPLVSPLAQHARAVATIGQDAPRIEAALSSLTVPVQRFDTLEAATVWAFEQAQRADAVLLSPACASLDMFKNYAHRAEVFVGVVTELAQRDGGMV